MNCEITQFYTSVSSCVHVYKIIKIKCKMMKQRNNRGRNISQQKCRTHDGKPRDNITDVHIIQYPS